MSGLCTTAATLPAVTTAIMGWSSRSRIRTLEVTDSSCRHASKSDSTGKSVSPSAAMAPLTLVSRRRPTLAQTIAPTRHTGKISMRQGE